ncbi:MAG: phenylalanine--tRNA ligase subunit beta [Paludibacteraceae bacterium]|nr:phenylalanine--tRNA ligase subunit beta [Paludibacteraceae bacterium]
MNISYNWLKQYVNTELPADEIAKILTSIGLEVGTVEEVQTIKGGLEGLVVGEVLSCENHPNSDHLHIAQVNIGTGEPQQIVCGAANCRAGLKTIVATLGTKLYDGDECFTIKKSKLRGVESNGMLCAEDEIGIGTSHDGIIELPADAKVGTPAKEYYNIKSDFVIEVDITPNRIDAASHYGVARDLAAYLKQTDSSVQLTKPSVDEFKIDNHDASVSVTVEDHEACPRYCGVALTGVQVKESPEWLQNALRIIGLRPINNVVDITNYVLHSFALPMHAFDLDKVAGGKIVVKKAAAGAKFVTLDGVERTLSAEDLMICNEKEPMCIAGVFGGLESGVTESTTSVFLEAAYFNPVSIRRTARRHGLNTDASFRYERGCDPNSTLYVLKYAAQLVKELAGGKVSSDIFDIYPKKIENNEVYITYQKINSLIGKEIPTEVVKSILAALEMQILKEDESSLTLSVPAYRVDVERDVDVIEDILRIYGYNNVIPGTQVKSSLVYSLKPDSNKLQNVISEQLTAAGFNEILNNSLTKVSYYENSSTYPIANAVKILNPLSNDLGVLRQTLFFGGMESLNRNINRRNADLKFYEFGNCYYFHPENRKEGDALTAYTEEPHFAMWLTGNKSSQTWMRKQEKTSVYELKAHVENVFRRLGFSLNALQTEDYSDDLLSEAILVRSRNKKVLAVYGVVSDVQTKKIDIDSDVFYADFNWRNLLAESKHNGITYKELPKTQEVKRDLSLLIDAKINFAEIEKIAFETEKKLLKDVSLFDVYQGKNLDAGKKSYAVTFILQDAEKTLTDSQIDAIMQKIQKNLETKLGAKLR